MESDHFEEAARFLRSALQQDADVGRIGRYDVERALQELEAGCRAQRVASALEARSIQL